MIAWAMK